ncbi:exosome complex exonuclease Rrp41 [Candidatus Micrarchaeota archaeon]|nr:exosome complex exonuclease Rrp41 [Candidatus Micrarchaeota archaeon]
MMGSNKQVELIKDGKRVDGRSFDELRPIKIEVGVLHRADGSCFLEWGDNKVIAGVYGPRECFPKHDQDPFKARLRYRYNMAPFSVNDRKRPGPDRRSTEISKVSREALEKVLLLEYFPRTSIDVFVEVLQAGAGTRCAALTAASVALADAGIPMKSLVVACAAGKVNDTIVLDLNQMEDNYGQADLPLGVVMTTGEIALMQMDGNLTRDEFSQAFDLVMKGAQVVYEKQKEALKEKYKDIGESDGQ